MVWGNACHKYISKLNKLHNRAGKTILRVNKRFPTDLMLDCLKWKTLLERPNYHLYGILYKCIVGQAPSYLCDTLVKVAENSPSCTRGSVPGNLKPRKFSTGSGKRTFKCRGSVAWNKLPLSIKHPLPPKGAFINTLVGAGKLGGGGQKSFEAPKRGGQKSFKPQKGGGQKSFKLPKRGGQKV